MELEGLRRAVIRLENYDLEIGTIITDLPQANCQMDNRDTPRNNTSL